MDIYVVQSGDTLTKIAEEIYGDGELWRLIYQENKKTLKSPDKIQVGQKLKIPDADTELVDEEAGEEEEEVSDTRPTLRVGSTSRTAVKALQAGLVAAGYEIAIDGSFGAGTKAAVLDLQTNASLDVDGVVGPATWAALDALAEESDDEEDAEEEEEDEESDDDDDDDDDSDDEEEETEDE